MGDTVKFHDRELINLFRKLEDVADGPGKRKMQNACGQAVLAGIHREFETEGEGEWPKLKAGHAIRRGRKVKSGFKMLADTGHLKQSFSVRRVDADRIVVGSNLAYARRQSRGGGGILSRPLNKLRQRTIGTVKSIIKQFLGG